MSSGEVAERPKALDSKSSVGQLTVGSNPTLSAPIARVGPAPGEVTERPKVYDWKSYVPQKGTEGSNPSLSAAPA